jgi:hypothetical protein
MGNQLTQLHVDLGSFFLFLAHDPMVLAPVSYILEGLGTRVMSSTWVFEYYYPRKNLMKLLRYIRCHISISIWKLLFYDAGIFGQKQTGRFPREKHLQFSSWRDNYNWILPWLSIEQGKKAQFRKHWIQLNL